MSSDIRRIVFNTRERLITDDLNNASALHHRALIELAAAMSAGDTQRYGVIRGLEVSAAGGTMSVSVSAGLAMILGTAPTTYDSDIEFIELAEDDTIDLTALVDGANPRWVVIEISATDAVELSDSRDIFSPSTGTFASASITKVSGSSPTIRAVGGTAAATPHLPAGSAGWIPLGYVYLTAAAVTVTAGDTIGCRPMLRTPGNVDAWGGTNLTRVNGGGVAVAADGLTAALRGCSGYFSGSHIPFSIGVSGSTANLDISTGGAWDGGSDPAADDVVYFYAIPAPYPAGYDGTLAPREFIPGSNMDNRFTALANERMSGCIVVASTATPNTGTIQGAPTGGNFTITAAPWGGAASVPSSTSVYLGAAFYGSAGTQLRAQSERGGVVYPLGGNQPNFNAGALASPQSIWGTGANPFYFPTTALEVLCTITLVAAAGQNPAITVTDETTSDYVCEEEPTVAQITKSDRVWLLPNATTGEVSFAVAGVAASALVRSVAYRDCILARR